jgi:hypothetical protein
MEHFQRLTSVNLGGVFLGSKHAVLQFKTQGRRVSFSTPVRSPGW